MKKLLLTIFIVVCMTFTLFADLDFCDQTVVVVMSPSHSQYTGSLSPDFFGSFEKVSVENIFQLHNEAAIMALNQRSPGQFRSIYKITLPTRDKTKVLEAIEELKLIEGIESATPDYILTTTVIPNDPLWTHPGLWNMRDEHGVQGPDAWDITTGSHEVRVGIIDTGVASHDDLDANMSFTGWNFAENNSTTHDTHSHGSRSAGIVGAVGNNALGVVGVNWNVTMIPMKIVVGGSGSSSGTVMAAAVNWAANKWGQEDEIPILTMSFSGYGQTMDLLAAINNFPGLFIWSAGNHGGNLDTYGQIQNFQVPNLIAVGAIDSNGNRSIWVGGQSSAYSASGQYVHVFAPGSDGWTTGLNNGFQDYGGTSMAAPHAAGVAALLLSINPTLTSAELKEVITNNYTPITITYPGGSVEVKRLNAYLAAIAVQPLHFDLAAISINGLVGIPLNEPSIFTIGLENRGLEPAEGYNVRLMQVGNDEPLAWGSGVYIPFEETGFVEIEWTPNTLGDHEIYAEIIWQFDQRLSNNLTENFELRVIPQGTAEAYMGNKNSELTRNNSFVNYNARHSIIQNIYLENELVVGNIYLMQVQFTGVHTLVFPGCDIQIYLATTQKSSFDSIFDWIPIEDFKLVYSGDLDAFEAGTYEIDIYFDTPFKYEGGNLVVMAKKSNDVFYGENNAFQFTPTPDQNRVIQWQSRIMTPPIFEDPLPQANSTLQGITNARFGIYTFDIEPPQNLQALTNGKRVNLTWEAPKDQLFGTLASYKIFRDGIILTEMSARSYSDESIDFNTEYNYWITAVYTNPELESAPSNIVTAVVENKLPPVKLTHEIVEYDTVILSWELGTQKLGTQASSLQSYGIPTGYKVLRNDNLLTSEPITETTFTEAEVPVGEHVYTVIAVYQTGDSEAISIDVEIEDVSDYDDPTPIFETALLGNFPNPFNPVTNIRFTLALDTIVSIDIYNIRGQRVVNLINDYLSKGEHFVIWNGRDENNRDVSSGMYFYIMQTEDFTQIKRMVLMK